MNRVKIELLKERLGTFSKRWREICWHTPLNQLNIPQYIMAVAVRMVYGLSKDFMEGHITLRAMSLVFSSLISIVPLLAFALALSKSFGAHAQLQPLLVDFFEPLGAEGVETALRIMEFVNRVDMSVLGSVGLIVLIITVIALVQKIEQAFNFIWDVSDLRPLRDRFTNYLSVILVGPLLVTAALSMTTSFLQSEFIESLKAIGLLGWVIANVSYFLPDVMIVIAFTMGYMFVPNVRVGLRPALVGAMSAAVVWDVTVSAFKYFVISSTQYSAIYSSFAIIIILLIWVYLCWLVILLGSGVSYYVQHPEQVSLRRRSLRLSHDFREWLALNIMTEVAQSFVDEKPLPTAKSVSENFGIPVEGVGQVVNRLVSVGLLCKLSGKQGELTLAKPVGHIQLWDIIHCIRSENDRLPVETSALKSESNTTKKLEELFDSNALVWKDVGLEDLLNKLE